jgi:inner membrane protein
MDTATHMVLGAATAELVSGNRVGNKAILWGAVAGIIPDLDIIPGQFMDTVTRMAFHRGFSHSLIFALVLAPVAGWIIKKIHKQEILSGFDWTKIFFLAMLSHILLDCFTTWGTQVFWPLDYRVAWNTIYVIDPLYSVPFAILMLLVIFTSKRNPWRRRLTYIALSISTGYLLLTAVNKQVANYHFEAALQSRNIDYTRLVSRPTPFNSILWAATIETADGFFEGYYSFFDEDSDIRFKFQKKNPEYAHSFQGNPEIQKIFMLTKGLYSLQLKDGGLAINDLRYGRMHGWMDDGGPFIFEYMVKPSPENKFLEITRNRIDRIPDSRIMRSFWQRILGG